MFIKKIVRQISTFLLLAASFFSIEAQTAPNKEQIAEIGNPFSVYQKGLQANDYLTPLLEFQRDEAAYMKSEQWKDLFLDLLAYLYSFTGKYDATYAFLDKKIDAQQKPLPNLQSAPFDGYEQRNALDAINSAADKYRVIMINEEHDTPMHRAFTTRLLPVLYKKGFRYLAAETFSDVDTELNSRGYPIQKTGFYSDDPVFGKMIRTALKLGFKLVPYEHRTTERCVSPADKPSFCQNERERGQAQNLYNRIFKEDPKAKVLVHVGRGHNQNIKLETWAQMGWYFRDSSRIETFSVNQMNSERSALRYERPEYRYVTGKWKFTEPIAFQSKTGEWLRSNGYDLQIYHPRTVYERGRPVWLKTGGMRRSYALYGNAGKNGKVADFLPSATGTYLVQAFVEGESADAIPVDQVIVTDPKNAPVLMLPKGRFRIRVINEAGKIIAETENRINVP